MLCLCDTNCSQLCESLPSCVNDPQMHSSYCKNWQDPPVCFGMYWTDDSKTSACFYPNDEACPQPLPIACVSSATTTSIPVDSTTLTVESNGLSGDYCGAYEFDSVLLNTRMSFNGTVVAMLFDGLLVGSIGGIPYTLDSDQIVLEPIGSYVDFLDNLPYKLVPADIQLNYTQPNISASVLGMLFNMTTQNCTVL